MTIEYIGSKIIENFPQFAGYVLIALVVGFIVCKCTIFYINTSKSITKLPAIEVTLKRIEQGFLTLNQVLLEKSVISQSCFSNENSPRVINELGKELLEKSGAKIVYDEIKSILMTELENKKFESLLELEQRCLEVLLQKRDDQKFKNIQNFAFEHPTFKSKPLTYIDILFVISLELRDDYRKNHPDSKLG